jgi:hypothetical protein
MQLAKFFKDGTPVTPENLGEAIQQAIEIEIATIPVYLYTYYSINRVPNQDAVSGGLVQELTSTGMSLPEANAVALDLSAQIMVYANKAGATLMSVVMEEMLHMALSSNLKQALIGGPNLTGRSPSSYPTMLPGHEPEFEIDLAPFSLNQLMTFLKIESPKPLTKTAEAFTVIPYKTIGEFYDMIKTCLDKNELTYNTELPQLVPGQRYYSPNMIDTVYYDKQHKPQYVDADDSGDLVHVVDRASANQAIDQIVKQGEGNKHAQGLNPDGSVNCAKIKKVDYDDPDREELSHFEKFAQVYCEYNTLSEQFASYGLDGNIGKYFVDNFPTNPSTASYPGNGIIGTDGTKYPDGTLQAVSTLLSGIYTYIFVMTEACYKPEKGNTPYEIFMFGIHKSMIFILDAICGDIQGLTYFSNGKVFTAAPTFENYPFGLLTSPKAQLIQLYNKAVALYPTISYLEQRINDLPDVALN